MAQTNKESSFGAIAAQERVHPPVYNTKFAGGSAPREESLGDSSELGPVAGRAPEVPSSNHRGRTCVTAKELAHRLRGISIGTLGVRSDRNHPARASADLPVSGESRHDRAQPDGLVAMPKASRDGRAERGPEGGSHAE